MKIALTIADCGDAAHVGGEVTRETFILQVDPASIHPKVVKYLESRPSYCSHSLSILVPLSTHHTKAETHD